MTSIPKNLSGIGGAQAFEPALRPKRRKGIGFAFQALHQFQRDAKKVPRSAGRIKDARVAQPVVKRANDLFGALALRRRSDADPFFPREFDHGCDDQPFDLSAGCNGLGGVQGLFEQRADTARSNV